MARLATLDKPNQPRTAAEDRAAEVLMTAADLIYRSGFAATSMNDIAKAVNLTKAGLYYYTKGKEDLLYKIICFAMDCVERDVMAPANKVSDPEARLELIIRRHLSTIFDTGGAITVMTAEVHSLPEQQRSEITARKRDYIDLVRRTMKELEAAGRLRKIDITIATLNMFATILGVPRWHNPDGRFPVPQVTDEIVNYILSGVLKDQ